MKKLLLVATVLAGGIAFAPAGVNVSIGIGLPLLPLPRPAIVVHQPVVACPPPVVYVPAPCAPRVVLPCPTGRYQPVYVPARGPRYADRYDRRDRRHEHGRRNWR